MTPDLRSKSTYTFTKLLTRIPIVLLVPAWLYNPLPTDTFFASKSWWEPSPVGRSSWVGPSLLVSISWVPSRSLSSCPPNSGKLSTKGVLDTRYYYFESTVVLFYFGSAMMQSSFGSIFWGMFTRCECFFVHFFLFLRWLRRDKRCESPVSGNFMEIFLF